MEGLGSVQHKVSCIFETAVLDEASGKREHQPYKVTATDTIKQTALECDVHNAKATEKLDGTCVCFSKFEDNPWLWARLDRKPNKGAERKFRKWQIQQQKRGQGAGEGDADSRGADGVPAKYQWNLNKDFKEPPPYWVPASGVLTVDGSPVPDDIGHTPGWVPVSPGSRQYCWHLSAVDLTNGLALILREDGCSDNLYIETARLADLDGHTAELIGTNINGNPYGLGNKQYPIHVFVIHGSIRVKHPPRLDTTAIREWFTGRGQVEGIVWHCANKTLFKLHRNHIGLPWPVKEPTLCRRPVEILVNSTNYELDDEKCLLAQLSRFNGHLCDSLKDLGKLLAPDCESEEIKS